jgi:hypothetical protein
MESDGLDAATRDLFDQLVVPDLDPERRDAAWRDFQLRVKLGAVP